MNNTKTSSPDVSAAPACGREWVSAWVDGPTHAAESANLEQALQAYVDDVQAREAWATYHWLGDVLREGAAAPGRSDPDFVAAVMNRLEAEPVVKAVPAVRAAANEPWFRWRWVAGVAGLGSMIAVAWQLTASTGMNSEPQWASADRQTTGSEPALVVLRDPQLDAFLAAHRGQGGMNALQKPAGFMRNATYEVSQR
ncbi:MAG: hypothetical protein RL323_545 [Pseudomonadota bacterium]|jgi:sigma-E factor negative regulatory protein RseA